MFYLPLGQIPTPGPISWSRGGSINAQLNMVGTKVGQFLLERDMDMTETMMDIFFLFLFFV